MSERNSLLEQIRDNTIGGFNPTTGMEIERLYDGSSALASQEPSARDIPLEVQFGAPFGTISDPVSAEIRSGSGNTEASILKINQAGTYRIKTSIQFGRTGASGTSRLNFRALINGVQAGRSISAYIENANALNLLVDEAWLTLPAGLEISYELIRDLNGSDSGGVFAGEVSGSTGWNASPGCSLRVERWIGSGV